jgi:hypothetical protein
MRPTSLQPNRGRGRGVLLGLGLTAALALAACGDSSSESETIEPLVTIVYHGTTASYVGPETIEGDKSFDIRFVNDSDHVIDFIFARIDPEASVTAEDAIAWDYDTEGKPPWQDGNYGHFAMNVQRGATVDERAYLFGGHRYGLWIWDATEQRVHFVTFVDVVPSEG